MFLSQITEEETCHRRQLTEFAVKLTLLAAAVGLALELFFCFIVLSPDQRILDKGLYLLMSVTTVVLGFLAIMLGMNRLKKIPHWVVSSLFLLALIFLILCSDTLQQLLNGPATMFFLVPIFECCWLCTGVGHVKHSTYPRENSSTCSGAAEHRCKTVEAPASPHLRFGAGVRRGEPSQRNDLSRPTFPNRRPAQVPTA